MIGINVKTTYTFLSSVITIDDLINYAKTNKLDNLFICDKNMYGVMEFVLKCQNNNIKPIVGVDFEDYLLFAKNYEGYQNLMKLTTLKSTKELDDNDYLEYHDNLICIVINKDCDASKLFSDIYYDSNIEISGNNKLVNAKEILCLDVKKNEVLKYLHMLRL